MVENSHVIYSSHKAAEEMFQAMLLVNNRMTFTDLNYVDEETAAANLDIAIMKQAMQAES